MDEVAAALAGLGNATAEAKPRVSRRFLVAAIAVSVATVAGIWVSHTPERAISYTLQAQRMRDGVPVGEPYVASASDVFEAGWKFRLRVRPSQAGFLYLINEGPNDAGVTRFWVLYPPEGAGAALAAGQELLTGWKEFDRNQGTEKVWMVWSERVLDAIEETLRGGTSGEVKDPAQAGRIRSLLAEVKRPAQLAGGGPASGVQLRAAEGVLGSLMELRHQ